MEDPRRDLPGRLRRKRTESVAPGVLTKLGGFRAWDVVDNGFTEEAEVFDIPVSTCARSRRLRGGEIRLPLSAS